MKCAILYSQRAGSKTAAKRWEQMSIYLRKKRFAYDEFTSDSFGHIEHLAGVCCSRGYDTIIVVGGDGSLNDALNGVMHAPQVPEGFALGVIPNGIGNEFARFWDMNVGEYQQTIGRIMERRTRKVDVGQCSFVTEDGKTAVRYFLNAMNVGLGARLISMWDEARRYSNSRRWSTMNVAVAQFFERKTFKMKLRIDTEWVEREVMSICIGNTQGYGQTPNAVPYNGYLDVSLITRPKWWQMLEGFYLLRKGQFLNYKNVHPYRAQEIEIVDTGKAPVSIDGKKQTLAEGKPLSITVMPERISFII